jgi:hypothetical protein
MCTQPVSTTQTSVVEAYTGALCFRCNHRRNAYTPPLAVTATGSGACSDATCSDCNRVRCMFGTRLQRLQPGSVRVRNTSAVTATGSGACSDAACSDCNRGPVISRRPSRPSQLPNLGARRNQHSSSLNDSTSLSSTTPPPMITPVCCHATAGARYTTTRGAHAMGPLERGHSL